MRQEGALEEITRHAVLVGAFAAMYLRQISGKFGLLVATRCHVRMRGHHLTPGAQAHSWPTFDGSNGHFARLVAHLFIETNTQQFLLLPFDLTRLLRS